MLHYTQQHQDISSLSLSPHLFNLPISLLSSSSFSPFAPAIRRAMGARITSPNSRRLLFPSSSLTSSSSSSSSTFFSPPFLPYSPAAAVLPWPPVLGVALMTMATTCHWSSFGRPVPNWTHVSVANARLFIIERLITFFLSSSSPSRYFFFLVRFGWFSYWSVPPNEFVFTFSDSSSPGGRVFVHSLPLPQPHQSLPSFSASALPVNQIEKKNILSNDFHKWIFFKSRFDQRLNRCRLTIWSSSSCFHRNSWTACARDWFGYSTIGSFQSPSLTLRAVFRFYPSPIHPSSHRSSPVSFLLISSIVKIARTSGCSSRSLPTFISQGQGNVSLRIINRPTKKKKRKKNSNQNKYFEL